MTNAKKTNDREVSRRRMKELEFLVRSSHTLNSTLDLDQLLARILKIVRQAMQVETVSVLFPDEEDQAMVFRMARGKSVRDLLGLRVPMGEGVVGWVAKRRRPAVINDMRSDPRYSAELERKLGLTTRSIISIPLLRRNKLIGVIEAVNRRTKDPFTDSDLSLFLALGDHIATAIDNARLYREAERSRLENSMLYKVSVALGRAISLDEVLNEILQNLKRLIPYDAAAIFVLKGKNQEMVSQLQVGYRPGREKQLHLKMDEGVSGWAARKKVGVIVPDTAADPRYVNARRRTRSEMVSPMMSGGKVIGMFNLESNRKNSYSTDDLRLLESFAAKAGVSIERATLYEEQRTKRAIERELRVARTVQEFFTPRRTHRVGGFTLTGRNYPSLELSGDYLDFFPMEGPNVAFSIADVAGKGVPAAIIMAGFRTTLHTLGRHYTSSANIVREANQILLETVRPQDFVTAFIGILNTETGDVNYCSAGHEPAILMRPDGRHRLLSDGGTVLGVLEDYPVKEGRFRLEDGFLLAYTDGIVDANDTKGRPFGRRRLLRFAKQHRDLAPGRFCTELHRRLKEYQRGAEQIDDLTFLMIKR